jgi:hypothetical protein
MKKDTRTRRLSRNIPRALDVALTGRMSQCQKALRLSEDTGSTLVEVLSREHRSGDRVPRAINGGLVERISIELYFPCLRLADSHRNWLKPTSQWN